MTAAELRAERQSWGMTQAELTRRLGVALSTLCAWEAGRRRIPDHAAVALRAILRPRVECMICHAEMAPGLDPASHGLCLPCIPAYRASLAGA